MKALISLINDLISILCDASYVAQKKTKKQKPVGQISSVFEGL